MCQLPRVYATGQMMYYQPDDEELIPYQVVWELNARLDGDCDNGGSGNNLEKKIDFIAAYSIKSDHNSHANSDSPVCEYDSTCVGWYMTDVA